MRQVDGHTQLMGLIGNPVEHTLSPVIHNTLSELLGLNGVYVPFHVENDRVDAAVKGAYALNVLGLNVTVPHKQAVMDSLAELDSVAVAIGAVNTLVRVTDGYKGYNTDMPGLLRAITSEGVGLEGKTVVMLGAGGAAKAVAYMCMQEKAERVYLLNRTVEKAQEIADNMNKLFSRNTIEALELKDYKRLPEKPWIVFQCTSLGLSPRTEDVVIEDPWFYQWVEVGIDLIYNPAETRFMKLVKEAGGKAFNGLKMLLYQGIIAYELWNDVQVTEEQAELVYDRLYEAIHPSGDNIVLIGFMGSGKSTVGQKLEQYGYSFLDTDAYIEEKEGRTISQIFQEEGEEYFRRLETQVLQDLIASTKHSLISVGGGTPLRRENARLLRELGQVFYLDVTEEVVWERVGTSTNRPLLNCEDPKERIRSLLAERRPIYEQAAQVRISTVNRSVEEIAEEIYQYRTGCERI